jgi:hypothetical protein
MASTWTVRTCSGARAAVAELSRCLRNRAPAPRSPTIYAVPRRPLGEGELLDVYRDYYGRHPFARVVEHLPATKDCAGSNFFDVTVRVVRDRVLVLGCLDNLVRGTSGVAVQNFSALSRWEREGMGRFPDVDESRDTGAMSSRVGPTAVASILLISAAGRLQLRERGIWVYTDILPWYKVGSYSWAADSTFLVRRGFFARFWQSALPVAAEQRRPWSRSCRRVAL